MVNCVVIQQDGSMKHSDNAACKIAEDMRQLLLSDEYSKGEAFLSSRQAAKLYNVSHVTASRALHILEQDGVIKFRHGVAPQIVHRHEYPRIVCFMTSDFSNIPPEHGSEAPRRFKLLLNELEKRHCEYRIYSRYDLQRENFSSRILNNADGLLAEVGFCDLHTRALAAGFNGPKVWLWSNEPILENGNQILPDYLPGLTEIFKLARRNGIKKCRLCYHRKFFGNVMKHAAFLSDWQSDEYTLCELPFPHNQLQAYRYAMNLNVTPDELYICEVDLTAFGFYQAFSDRGYQPGDFNITGIGNLEGRGHLPLGEAVITTLGNDLEYRIKRIVDILLDNVDSGVPQSLIERIPSKLIVRKSAFYHK